MIIIIIKIMMIIIMILIIIMPQQWASRVHWSLATNTRSVTNQSSSSDTKPFTASRDWLYKLAQGCNLPCQPIWQRRICWYGCHKQIFLEP
jgi:hypothetical protein